MNYRFFFIIPSLLIFILNPENLSSAGDNSVFKKIVNRYSLIRTIDSEIIQHISIDGKAVEIFKGRYRADSSGRFRLDYYQPEKQVVLNNSKGLFWYYFKENILYRIGRNLFGTNPKMNPLSEFSGDIGKRFNVKYIGRRLYGASGMSELYRLNDIEKGLYISLWLDSGRNVLLKKVVSDQNDRELIKEIYSGYEKIGKLFFPGRLDVYIRTGRGVTRNSTRYMNVKLNRRFKNRVFALNFPADAEKRRFYEK